MYNAQSYSIGSSTSTSDLDRQDSNGVQVVLDTERHNRAQYMQNLDRQEMAHESHTNGMMLSSIPLLNNFQVSAGLMRYHSAPGSFLAALIDNGANVISHENGMSQILSNDSSVASVSQHNDTNQKLESEQEQNNYSKIASHLRRSSGSGRDDFAKHNNQLAPIIEHGMEMPQNNYSSSEMTMLYHQTQGSQSGGENVVNNNKLKSENAIYSDLESCSVKYPLPRNKHSLCRQSSSPVGVLSRLAASAQGITENGYLGGMPNEQISTSRESGNGNNSSKQNHQMNHLTRENSCPAGLLAHIPLNMDFQQYNGKFNMNTGHPSGESLVRCSSDSARLRNADQMWENGSILSGNYDAVQSDSYLSPKKRKREMELQDKLEEDPRSHGGNNHHFGLFKSMSSDLSLEKILEESVPCRIRAKRGCATHPRSIAERVRRTRISDRIRKLQDLVPNMDKQQTNTADMLDEAVEYVKFLQKKVEELSDRQSKCTCGSNQKVDEHS